MSYSAEKHHYLGVLDLVDWYRYRELHLKSASRVERGEMTMYLLNLKGERGSGHVLRLPNASVESGHIQGDIKVPSEGLVLKRHVSSSGHHNFQPSNASIPRLVLNGPRGVRSPN